MSKQSLVAWKPQNYERRVASARIRCLNNLDYLQSQAYPIELYKERNEQRYRAVVFSKAYNSKDIVIAERLKAQGTKIVFDLCDNHFVSRPDRHERLQRMFELADHWVVSSQALATVVRERMGTIQPLTVIEDAVEESLSGKWWDVSGRLKAYWQLLGLRRFLLKQQGRGATPLVWFGNHKASYKNSGLAHMEKLRPLLEKMQARQPLSLTVISSSREAFDKQFSDWQIPVAYIDWNAHTFFRAMRYHRVALIPIEVNAFTAVKTNNRIALSLFLGLAVVADAIDSYRVFDNCVSLNDWEHGLDRYIEDADLHQQHVTQGRMILHEHFSLPVIADQWRQLLDKL